MGLINTSSTVENQRTYLYYAKITNLKIQGIMATEQIQNKNKYLFTREQDLSRLRDKPS